MKISRTIWLLSLVSLFTDISSEMLYPVMPLYLESIGFSIILIGVLEGMAEATAGLSKGYFGHLSDTRGKRLPFVQLGYFLSALSKPMLAIFTWTGWVFSARTLDRLGKGLRTGARDALLSLEATPSTKGSVFGFHRSMDTLGAAIGPLLAIVFLNFYPGQYRWLFFLAFIPGLLGVFTTFLVKEKENQRAPDRERVFFLDFLKYIPRSRPEYRHLLLALLIFTLLNSSDVFLLLMLKYYGLNDVQMISLYIFYNLVYALFAYPLGRLADRIGLKKMFIIGLICFIISYLGMGSSGVWPLLLVWFFMYGLFAACTEGVSKAWISNLCAKPELATAIGTYEALRSVTTLVASSVAGVIWFYWGPQVLFLLTASLVTLTLGLFARIRY